MILSEFYYGKKEIFCIYHNGRIIWEKNKVRTVGQLIAALCGITLPTVELTENVLMYTDISLNGIAIPENMSADISGCVNIVVVGDCIFEEHEPVVVIMRINDGLITDVAPHSVDVKYGFGNIINQLTCIAYPNSYGLVFTRGNVDCVLTGISLSRSVKTTRSRGNAVWKIVGIATPIDEDMLRIYMPVNSEIINISIPCTQELEQINMTTTMELVGLANPMSLHNYTVIFMNDITKLYETKVLEGYSCEDPVKADIIPAPTKTKTVSHTYKHSGWSRIENGVAEDLSSITDDTIFYATFDEFIRYYTVNFYLDNNLVNTQEVAYGEMAVVPNITKEGYIIEWMINDLTIYGNTDFYGVCIRDYIINKKTVSFAYEGAFDLYRGNAPTIKPMEKGRKYIVVWDGKEYLCNMHTMYYNINNEETSLENGIGNATILKYFLGYGLICQENNTGEPFLINYSDNYIYIFTQNSNSLHTVSIYAV